MSQGFTTQSSAPAVEHAQHVNDPFNTIPTPPLTLSEMLGGRWFRWQEVEPCFWPGPGRRSSTVNRELAEIKDYGGVYLLAWSDGEPSRCCPQRASEVKYVGETNWFKGRMLGFGWSAGFWGARCNGHSAAWSWPEGATQKLWLAFFDVGTELLPHLAVGMRRWVEAVAQEEYRLAHGTLPQLNAVKRHEVVEF